MITAMKTSTMALCITFFLLITTAFAANGSLDSGEQNGSPEIGHRYGPKKNSQSNGSPPGGRGSGPPQEAIDACSEKNEGDKVEFETPRGHTISGTCKKMANLLFAIPEGGPPRRGRDQQNRGQR